MSFSRPASTVREALHLVGSLEHASEHPVGARDRSRRGRRTPSPSRRASRTERASASKAIVDGHAVIAGRPSLLEEWGLELPQALIDARRLAEAEGKTAVAAGWDGSAKALFVVSDQVKPTSRDAISRLKALGLRPILLTATTSRPPGAVAERGRDQRSDRRGAARARRPTSSSACRPKGASSRWSATA